ncbi:MAG: AAA family ATPase [Gammaproteobacteria bacterium]|nr:AAA family ATPase [Gammaproteobacteria bacterium]
MQRVVILNSKGGSGKTTISTNLASLSATRGKTTVLMDYDPQHSSMHWSERRGGRDPRIHVIDACVQKSKMTRSWQIRLPDATDQVIMDAPAGVSGLLLQELMPRADVVLIPVAPSTIDIQATADFIRDLLLASKIRSRISSNELYIGIIANRIRSTRPVYEPLKRFLARLDIPFVAALSDTDNYITAAEQGIGIYEMNPADVAIERAEWRPLIEWLDRPSHHAPELQRTEPQPPAADEPSNLQPLRPPKGSVTNLIR